MTLEQFVSFVHEKSSARTQAAVANGFRNHKGLEYCTQASVLNASKIVDPKVHPVGHGCILSLACAPNSPKRDADCWAAMIAWLELCDEAAMKCIPCETALICRALVADAMEDASQAEAALCTFILGMKKMQPSKEHMTPFHAAILQASIKCKRYAVGRKVLEEEIYCLCDTGLNATDYLLYYYYGGLVCAALKEHTEALKFLETAITMPTMVPDAIVIAAWHRYQIITALSTGQAAVFPKHASPACKHVKTSGRESETVALLVRAFLGNKRPALEKLMRDEHVYIRSENLVGLVWQMHDQMISHAIRKMTATYMTLPLATIATDVGLQGPEEAAKHVFKMIAAGDVNAVIDEEAGMVKFKEGGHSAPISIEALQARMVKVADLQRRLVLASRSVRLESKYVGHLLRQDYAAASAGHHGLTGLDVGDMTPDAMDDS